MDKSERNSTEVEKVRRPWMVYVYIALTIVIVSSGLNWFESLQVKEQKAVVENNSAVQAQTNLESDICMTTPKEPLCQVARQVVDNPTELVPGVPGPKGPEGAPGQDGKDGEDGKTITGPPGKNGTNGKDSTVPGPPGANSTVPGPKGATGSTGKDSTVPGPRGSAGQDGKSIVGPSGPAGKDGKDSTVPGPAGANGEPGAAGQDGEDGSVITGMTCSDGVLVLSFTYNGAADTVSTDVVCDLPAAPAP